ncbi:ATP-binding protein [Streptomyces sp. GC420]|nr:ATP-binding protein [Streptomyces sp. GC420]
MLEHRPEAVAQARRIADESLARWQASEQMTEATLLVVSELVTNAVEHARPPLVLHLHLRQDEYGRRVRVEVIDGGPAAHHGTWAASCRDGEHGRGLEIVDLVSTAHGDHVQTGRATHWADLVVVA